jgi:TonB family protein
MLSSQREISLSTLVGSQLELAMRKLTSVVIAYAKAIEQAIKRTGTKLKQITFEIISRLANFYSNFVRLLANLIADFCLIFSGVSKILFYLISLGYIAFALSKTLFAAYCIVALASIVISFKKPNEQSIDEQNRINLRQRSIYFSVARIALNVIFIFLLPLVTAYRNYEVISETIFEAGANLIEHFSPDKKVDPALRESLARPDSAIKREQPVKREVLAQNPSHRKNSSATLDFPPSNSKTAKAPHSDEVSVLDAQAPPKNGGANVRVKRSAAFGTTSEAWAESLAPPSYPASENRRGVGGEVDLLLRIDRSGIVTKVDLLVSSGNFNLDNAAIRAAYGWRFHPKLDNGIAVDSTKHMPVTFIPP